MVARLEEKKRKLAKDEKNKKNKSVSVFTRPKANKAVVSANNSATKKVNTYHLITYKR